MNIDMDFPKTFTDLPQEMKLLIVEQVIRAEDPTPNEIRRLLTRVGALRQQHLFEHAERLIFDVNRILITLDSGLVDNEGRLIHDSPQVQQLERMREQVKHVKVRVDLDRNPNPVLRMRNNARNKALIFATWSFFTRLETFEINVGYHPDHDTPQSPAQDSLESTLNHLDLRLVLCSHLHTAKLLGGSSSVDIKLSFVRTPRSSSGDAVKFSLDAYTEEEEEGEIVHPLWNYCNYLALLKDMMNVPNASVWLKQ